MDHTASHIYSAPVDEVWDMYTNPDAHVARFARMGHRDIEVLSSLRTDDTFEVTMARIVDYDVPRFARKLLQPSNKVISTERWHRNPDGTATGTWSGSSAGVPITVAGTTGLAAVDGDTRCDIGISVAINIPLIGGRVAAFARANAEQQVEQDFAAGDAWLAARVA